MKSVLSALVVACVSAQGPKTQEKFQEIHTAIYANCPNEAVSCGLEELYDGGHFSEELGCLMGMNPADLEPQCQAQLQKFADAINGFQEKGQLSFEKKVQKTVDTMKQTKAKNKEKVLNLHAELFTNCPQASAECGIVSEIKRSTFEESVMCLMRKDPHSQPSPCKEALLKQHDEAKKFHVKHSEKGKSGRGKLADKVETKLRKACSEEAVMHCSLVTEDMGGKELKSVLKCLMGLADGFLSTTCREFVTQMGRPKHEEL